MSETTTANTIAKLLGAYPPDVQRRALEQFRDYLDEITDELRWEDKFESRAPELEKAARDAKAEIAEKGAEEMDFEKL